MIVSYSVSKRFSYMFIIHLINFIIFSVAAVVASAYIDNHNNNIIPPLIQHRSSSRYSTGEILLPPLSSTCPNNNNQNADNNNNMLPVVYTNDPQKVSHWLSDHVPKQGCVLGFDVESAPRAPWVKSAYQGPAVVQLATPESALVVHLTKPSGRFSRACQPLLEAVLRDERIIKTGCGVDLDILELRSVWNGLDARGRFDLCCLREIDDKESPGLKTLSACLLGVDLPKSRSIAVSDWTAFPLTPRQVAYSARDAWAGAAIAAELALIDPDTFGFESLVDRLRSQRSINDLYNRHKARKQAKFMISLVLGGDTNKVKRNNNKKQKKSTRRPILPKWKLKLVRDLKKVVRENKHIDGDAFGVKGLPLQNTTSI